MSASERLAALGPPALDALDELSSDAGWAHAYQPGGTDAPDREPDVRAVLAVLPEIVAVVENAERIFGYIEDEQLSGPTVVKLRAALAALDAKLGNGI